ncbi:MAG TPA: protein kinase [Polyangiaceae bacterium]|nr:protein kinase [Polyangiaceae bacterium]
MADDLERTAGVRTGEILADKYRVERVLGVGGMGVVVAARHLELEERVAIKLLLPAMLADANAVARFQREARAAVRIKSEHVARVFDVGRLPNGAPYMVMEFLEGMDLAAWVAHNGALPVLQAVDFVVQACVAVADAHALGIIHRDLKPANLFCVRRSDGQPSIKVLDFGISKLADAAGAGISFTQTSATMGSPLYMSPEQFRSSKSVDARTDIWALGAILFELVTGQVPFSATTVTELAIKVATERAPSAAVVRHGVPPALAAVIAKCLEADPLLRYANVAELTVALAPFASPGTRSHVERVIGIVGTPSMLAVQSQPLSAPAGHAEGRTAPALHYTSPDSSPLLRRRGNMGRTVGVVTAVVALGATGIGWWRMHGAAPVAAGVDSAAATVTIATNVPPSVPVAPPGTAALGETAPPPASSAKVAAPPESPTASPIVEPTEPSQDKVERQKLAPRPTAKGKRGAAAPPGPTSTPAPPPPKPAPAAPPRVSCDPPFFFDSHGNRVFKPECM